ncbi:hypothetical protein GTR02_14900 [Kineococcus sp. R8]|uniref:hypothetical protein n=1 Tax=Kineococcus siccus TaxID=2696567 RepID=UPI001412705A|nr:hypothetical protein [Kineococcus siccus]NAZ83106.1 hypothetical protein [Kineococcus siccus]
MSEQSSSPTTPSDPDADPGQLNPRDERGEESVDGAAESDGPDPDGDPGQLNPRD